MNNLPDFASHGYRVKRELGCNPAGGRTTYQAIALDSLQPVVIKQFQFARSNSNWADYETYQREIQILKALDHPGIPKYLDSFQTSAGFCMVQQYISAPALSMVRSFSLEEIRTIAIKALEILIYLQNRVPPVIHRDIKPDNILVSDNVEVYLVDFGFARIGHGEVGVSSVVKGTLGFMPPEQIFNRQLTTAADLYGLGITLICLLTNTRSVDVGNLIDITYRINFRTLLPNLSLQWLSWLEKMVEPRVKDRFPNAAIALSSLPKEIVFAPQACLSTSAIAFEDVKCGAAPLVHQVQIQNSVPHTQLCGRWSVVPHPSDPQVEGTHAWISFSPRNFQSNDAICEIWVDTTRLMPGRTYIRELCLDTNAAHQTYQVTLQIQTRAALKTKTVFPYGRLGLLWGGAIAGTWVLGLSAVVVIAIMGLPTVSTLGVASGIVVGLEVAAGVLAMSGAREGASAGGLGGIVGGVFVLALVAIRPIDGIGLAGLVGIGFGMFYGLVAGLGAGTLAEQLSTDGLKRQLAIALALLVVGWGSSLGLGLAIGFTLPVVGLLVGLLGVPLLAIVFYHPLHRLLRQNRTRQRMRHFIKP